MHEPGYALSAAPHRSRAVFRRQKVLDGGLCQDRVIDAQANKPEANVVDARATKSQVIAESHLRAEIQKLSSAEVLLNIVEVKNPEYLRICIKDNGTGIEAADIDKVFRPFFTTKAVGKGTGLGLAAVYGTVRNHHGGLYVKSDPGAGSGASNLPDSCQTPLPFFR